MDTFKGAFGLRGEDRGLVREAGTTRRERDDANGDEIGPLLATAAAAARELGVDAREGVTVPDAAADADVEAETEADDGGMYEGACERDKVAAENDEGGVARGKLKTGRGIGSDDASSAALAKFLLFLPLLGLPGFELFIAEFSTSICRVTRIRSRSSSFAHSLASFSLSFCS